MINGLPLKKHFQEVMLVMKSKVECADGPSARWAPICVTEELHFPAREGVPVASNNLSLVSCFSFSPA